MTPEEREKRFTDIIQSFRTLPRKLQSYVEDCLDDDLITFNTCRAFLLPLDELTDEEKQLSLRSLQHSLLTNGRERLGVHGEILKADDPLMTLPPVKAGRRADMMDFYLSEVRTMSPGGQDVMLGYLEDLKEIVEERAFVEKRE